MLVTVAPVASSIFAASWPASTPMTSGFVSQRATQQGLPLGSWSGNSTPDSRNGRSVPGSTPKKNPLLLEVALASFTLPKVGATTVREAICTRIPSYRSSWSNAPCGSIRVRTTGAGNGFPVEIRTTLDGELISVSVAAPGTVLDVNSFTGPVTQTLFPGFALVGSRLALVYT